MSQKSNRPELLQRIEALIDNLTAINDKSGQYLQRLADGRVIDTKGWEGWEWTHGIGLFGLFRYQQLTGSPRARQLIDDWFSARFAEGTPEKNINTACPFLTLALRYQQAPRSDWRAYLDCWGEAIYRQMPRTDEGCLQHVTYESAHQQQIWDDTLMMAVLPLAILGKMFDKPRWVEEAIYQFLQHLHYLSDRQSGLWYHGWHFAGRHHFAGALWARGNSWITLAIPELLEMLDLDEHDAVYRQLQNTLQIQVAALPAARVTTVCGQRCSTTPTAIWKPRRPPGLPPASSKRYASAIWKRIICRWPSAPARELSTIFHHRVNCCRCRSAPRWATTLITIVTSRSPPCPMARRWRCCAWWKPCIARCKSVT